MRKPLIKILLAIPFLAIGILIYFLFKPVELENFNSSFISISLTIATFSISFSFLQYTFSPYKSLLRSISTRQLIFTYATLIVALAPIGGLVINKSLVPQISLFTIPLLAYNILLLWTVAYEECNPVFLLNRAKRPKKLLSFLQRFKDDINQQLITQESFNFSKGDETPSHDWGDKYSVTVPGDPFHLANMIAEHALKNGDVLMYVEVVRSYGTIIDAMLANPMVKEMDFRFKIERLVGYSFRNLVKLSGKLSDNPVHRNELILSISNYLREKALLYLQTRNPFENIAGILTDFAEELVSKDRDAVILVLSLHRQLCQKGIYDPPPEQGHEFFKLHLPVYPMYIKRIGQAAIRDGSSEMMYRCLEELGYLGCSAVKNYQFQVIIETLQSIVQLGRESRAAGLVCFDQRCTLDPPAHAKERLWWMLSWIHHLSDDKVQLIHRSFETAYSRLSGFKTTIVMSREGDQPVFDINESKEPHVEGYISGNHPGKIDYSDPKQIKEYKLY
ncbi:ABC transporter permease [Mucilaginibacter sp. OK098]|uniref:ABC transporter permease n=1 Tax=Mucilaginibacter sp. OK098 TaxID=1855297 RepID=UPI00091658C3|nr:ABC transporter permease [Mucilaginibacter sp. OK098]SHM81110.1 hypothetical protein SAMN05216524_103497 [Mucilaginibacter sp. OK098]